MAVTLERFVVFAVVVLPVTCLMKLLYRRQPTHLMVYNAASLYVDTGSSGAVARVMMGSATQLATFAQTRQYIINSQVGNCLILE